MFWTLHNASFCKTHWATRCYAGPATRLNGKVWQMCSVCTALLQFDVLAASGMPSTHSPLSARVCAVCAHFSMLTPPAYAGVRHVPFVPACQRVSVCVRWHIVTFFWGDLFGFLLGEQFRSSWMFCLSLHTLPRFSALHIWTKHGRRHTKYTNRGFVFLWGRNT